MGKYINVFNRTTARFLFGPGQRTYYNQNRSQLQRSRFGRFLFVNTALLGGAGGKIGVAAQIDFS